MMQLSDFPEFLQVSSKDPVELRNLALTVVVGFLLALLIFRLVIMRIVKYVAADVAKSTLKAVLEDDKLMALSSKRWVEIMVNLNQNPDFQRTTPDAIMSEMIQDRMQTMFTKLLQEKDFVKSSVSAMHDVIHDDTLKEAVKDQLRQTFEDELLHKAILKGSLEAMKPSWVKALEGTDDYDSRSGGGRRGNNTPPQRRGSPDARSCG